MEVGTFEPRKAIYTKLNSSSTVLTQATSESYLSLPHFKLVPNLF